MRSSSVSTAVLMSQAMRASGRAGIWRTSLMPYIDNSGVRSRVKGHSVKIGQIAKRAGVTVDTVRFYERVGVLPEPARRPSGYREYEPAVIDRIRLTRELQAIGFSLTEV